MKRSHFVILLVVLILVLDQWLKIWVKTNMAYGEEFTLLGLNWARIHFVENEGMAFGLKLGGDYGKLILSVFRIVVVSFLIYFIGQLIKEKMSFGLLASVGAIMAGALGNILDSMFYGLIFSESDPFHGKVAELFPADGGYASFLHGKVVDMFYFPMFKGVFPDWLPLWGGESFLFFRPVFNIADAAISVGVVSIILFHRHIFRPEEDKPAPAVQVATSDIEDGNETVQIDKEVS
ncbi:MAG: lipoprotein signal peptidase [Saprospiraceae bacterium]|nr:lipoprotein signal peptidase [Saprospiraceae bacterium]